MITRTDTGVNITIKSEDLIKSIALLKDLRDFCLKQEEETEGRQETADALLTAIETMEAFWSEKFGDEE